ncbi:MAG: hypothetical protein ACRCX2_13905 [Paraclostridium sp.]
MKRILKNKAIVEHHETVKAINEQIKAIEEQIHVNTLKAQETALKINSTTSADELNQLFTIKNNIIQIDQLLQSRIEPLKKQISDLDAVMGQKYFDASIEVIAELREKQAILFNDFTEKMYKLHKEEMDIIKNCPNSGRTALLNEPFKFTTGLRLAFKECNFVFNETKTEMNGNLFD